MGWLEKPFTLPVLRGQIAAGGESSQNNLEATVVVWLTGRLSPETVTFGADKGSSVEEKSASGEEGCV